MIHVAVSQASGFPLTFVLSIENGVWGNFPLALRLRFGSLR